MKYTLSILSIILTFVFLEIFLRIFFLNSMNYEIEMMKYANNFKKISKNKDVGLEHKKNIRGFLMGVDIIIDENGFRDQLQNKNRDKKILMLGDSMTFGWGASETFSSILDKKITSHKILNAGVGNTNTIMQINNFFENLVNKFEYDVVVLNFLINDFENINIIKPNIAEKYSYLYTFISNKVNTIFIKLKFKKNWQNFYSESYMDEQVKLKTLSLINKLNNYCNENNIKFIIHNIPELRNLKNYKFDKETAVIKNYANENNIKFIDSFSVLKKYEENSLWVTAADPHANDKAHEIIADFLYNEIRPALN